MSKELNSVSFREFCRKRPAMFIGDLCIGGFKNMLTYFFEELLDDNFSNPVIELDFFPQNKIILKIKGVNKARLVSTLESYNESNGFGLKAFFALSSSCFIRINDLHRTISYSGQKGNLSKIHSEKEEKENCIFIDHTIDPEIFKDLKLEYEYTNYFLKQFAFLNPTLKIISIDKTQDSLQQTIFHYPAGVLDQLDHLIAQQAYWYPRLRLDIASQINNTIYKIAICYSGLNYEKTFIRTYANNIETYFGGSLKDGIIDGLTLALKSISEKKPKESFKINKTTVSKELILIAAVRGEDFIFLGSTKRKLGVPQIRKDAKKLVFEKLTYYFEQNPKIADDLLWKFKVLEDDREAKYSYY